jgi:hypothetical protein
MKMEASTRGVKNLKRLAIHLVFVINDSVDLVYLCKLGHLHLLWVKSVPGRRCVP